NCLQHFGRCVSRVPAALESSISLFSFCRLVLLKLPATLRQVVCCEDGRRVKPRISIQFGINTAFRRIVIFSVIGESGQWRRWATRLVPARFHGSAGVKVAGLYSLRTSR